MLAHFNVVYFDFILFLLYILKEIAKNETKN